MLIRINKRFKFRELQEKFEELIPGTFCIDDVITSHGVTFNWKTNVALFYCDKQWPYNEFRVNRVEKFVYGFSLSVSSLFLVISIAIYLIKLRKMHCNVHTWIELFYMTSLLMLAVFCILQINFPENHVQFCSFYHFVCK